MSQLCEERVCIVTGAGRSIGKAHALMLAAHSARVVVNDLGGSRDGTGHDESPAEQVVDEIEAAGSSAFDISPDGSLSNRRVWAQLEESTIVDGCCLDQDGAIWVATPQRSEVIRVREGGEITHSVSVETDAYSCGLGGPDRQTLLICTATASAPGEAYPRLGHIDCVRVDTPGAGLP